MGLHRDGAAGKLLVTEALYQEWVKNKTKNPATGRIITLDGPTARLYKKYGKKASASKKGGDKASKKGGDKASKKDKGSSDICHEWEKIKAGPSKDNKLINPLTGRRILRDGPVYNAVDKLCEGPRRRKDCNKILTEPWQNSFLELDPGSKKQWFITPK